MNRWVYFIGPFDGSEVKIGMTDNRPAARRKQLENERRIPLRTLGVVRTSERDGDLHKTFPPSFERIQSARGGTEDFNPVGEMREWIRWVMHQPFTGFEEEADSLPVVPLSQFRPAPGRYISSPVPTTLFDACDDDDPWQDVLPSVDDPHDSWWLPDEVLVPALDVLGKHNLMDVATDHLANRRIGAPHYYTPQRDGLEHSWRGDVLLHPNFTDWRLWARKAADELTHGHVDQMIAVMKAGQISGVGVQSMLAHSSVIGISRWRIPFDGPSGAATKPPYGYVFAYFGGRPETFERAFHSIATLYRPVRSMS